MLIGNVNLLNHNSNHFMFTNTLAALNRHTISSADYNLAQWPANQPRCHFPASLSGPEGTLQNVSGNPIPKIYQFHSLSSILPILRKGRTTVDWTWWRHQNANNKGLSPQSVLANSVPACRYCMLLLSAQSIESFRSLQ